MPRLMTALLLGAVLTGCEVGRNYHQPATPVDWSNPNAQWSDFVGGCQNADGSRACRPTGVAIGTDGSLFVSEDQDGAIYRIRPQH